MPRDLNELPHICDSLTYLYIDKAIVERDRNAIVIIRSNERIPVPVSSLTVLMLGPGTSVTHAAIRVMSENGCLAVWCGDHAMRYYALGMGETRSAKQIEVQAKCYADEEKRLQVAKRMFSIRFPGVPVEKITMQQLRGLEGARVREAYRLMARKFNIRWKGRNYNQDSWGDSDELNIALSSANVCLYSLCEAAIVSLGFSTALGFVHTGKQMSFVYDVADLYKMTTSIPVAFEAVSMRRTEDLDKTVRVLCRQAFRTQKLMKRIPHDLAFLFELKFYEENKGEEVGNLWDNMNGNVVGGINYAGVET